MVKIRQGIEKTMLEHGLNVTNTATRDQPLDGR